jgi:hypothetical protein
MVVGISSPSFIAQLGTGNSVLRQVNIIHIHLAVFILMLQEVERHIRQAITYTQITGIARVAGPFTSHIHVVIGRHFQLFQ